MRLAELQRRMQQTLLYGDADTELLALFADPPEQRERRLAVYRNNVRHALLSVLEAAFPVIRQLIGAECFTATALAFIADHPPHKPALYRYGAAWPEFIAHFPPLVELPWLADTARLEWARNAALFDAEREPLTPEQLAMVAHADLPGLRLALHPSAHVLASRWPVHAIWTAHQPNGAPLETVNLDQAETVLIWRQAGSVRQRAMMTGESTLLAALAAEQPLADAAGLALSQNAEFDLSAALATMLSGGVLIREKIE